jgi:glycosyltransferase involved in cell wall biosynthesis
MSKKRINSLVSIIVPTYNRGNLIAQTIMSIINQKYELWECLVVDDFSNDNTKEVVESFICSDNRIKYISNKRRKGAQGARNTGLSYASGEFIMFFDSDNIMYPNHIEKKVVHFRERSNVDIVTSFSHVLNIDSEVVGTFCWITEGNIHKDILSANTYVDTNSAMFRSQILRDHGYLDENCPSYQEWDLHIAISKNSNYSFIPEFLTGYYRRELDTISSNRRLDLEGRIYLISKYGPEIMKIHGRVYYSYKTSHLIIEGGINNIAMTSNLLWINKDYFVQFYVVFIIIYEILKKPAKYLVGKLRY